MFSYLKEGCDRIRKTFEEKPLYGIRFSVGRYMNSGLNYANSINGQPI